MKLLLVGCRRKLNHSYHPYSPQVSSSIICDLLSKKQNFVALLDKYQSVQQRILLLYCNFLWNLKAFYFSKQSVKVLLTYLLNFDVFIFKGQSLYGLGNQTGAKYYFDKALGIDPNNELAKRIYNNLIKK